MSKCCSAEIERSLEGRKAERQTEFFTLVAAVRAIKRLRSAKYVKPYRPPLGVKSYPVRFLGHGPSISRHEIPFTVLYQFVFLVPLALLICGTCWIFAATGVFSATILSVY